MAWARAELSSDETTRYDADLPILAYGNGARSPTAAAQWRSSGSWASGSDETDATQPAKRAYDDCGYLRTATGTHGATVYYLMNLANVSFDTVAIIGHNFGDLSSITSVTFTIADNNSYTSNAQAIAQWTVGFGGRLVQAQLGGNGLDGSVVHSARYSNVQWARIAIAYGGSGDLPAIGEIVLATRVALPNRPEMPIHERTLESKWGVFTGDNGHQFRHEDYAGRLAVSPMWRPDSSTYAAQFRTWFAGTSYGYRPFLWIPQPTGNKMEAYFCRTQPALSVTPVNGVEMNVTIPLLEDPPYVERE